MASNFSKIKIGAYFNTKDGTTYRKTSELTFDDMAKIEHYIDPLFDKTIVGLEPTYTVPEGALPKQPAKKKSSKKKKAAKTSK